MSDNLRAYFFNKNIVDKLYKRLFVPITSLNDIDLATQYAKYIYTRDDNNSLYIGIYSLEDINNITIINNINFIIQSINSLIKGSLSIDMTSYRLNEDVVKRLNRENINLSIENIQMMSKMYPDLERLDSIYKGLYSINPTIRFNLIQSNISITEGLINPSNKAFIRLSISSTKDDINYTKFCDIDLMADYSSRIKELNGSISKNISYKDIFIPPLDIPYKSLLIKVDKGINLMNGDIIKFCNSLVKRYESDFQFIDVNTGRLSLDGNEVSSYSHYTFIDTTSVLSGQPDIKSINS